MLIVFVAICSLSMPVQDCQKDTALDWMAAPERQHGLPGCLKHGQQYLAESRLLTEGTFGKIFCKFPGGNGNVG